MPDRKCNWTECNAYENGYCWLHALPVDDVTGNCEGCADDEDGYT